MHNNQVPVQLNKAYGRHVTHHISTAVPNPVGEYETVMSYEPEYERLPGDTTEEDYI